MCLSVCITMCVSVGVYHAALSHTSSHSHLPGGGSRRVSTNAWKHPSMGMVCCVCMYRESSGVGCRESTQLTSSCR